MAGLAAFVAPKPSETTLAVTNSAVTTKVAPSHRSRLRSYICDHVRSTTPVSASLPPSNRP